MISEFSNLFGSAWAFIDIVIVIMQIQIQI